MDSVILVGFMGAGKSTVGRILAKRLDLPFLDMDEVFEVTEGMSVSDYFNKYSESGFRQREAEILADHYRDKAIIATGGGAVVTPANRELLSKAPNVVYLQSDAETLWDRVVNDQTVTRPLINQSDLPSTKNLLNERLDYYDEVASYKIDTTPLSPDEVADEVMKWMKDQK